MFNPFLPCPAYNGNNSCWKSPGNVSPCVGVSCEIYQAYLLQGNLIEDNSRKPSKPKRDLITVLDLVEESVARR